MWLEVILLLSVYFGLLRIYTELDEHHKALTLTDLPEELFGKIIYNVLEDMYEDCSLQRLLYTYPTISKKMAHLLSTPNTVKIAKEHPASAFMVLRRKELVKYSDDFELLNLIVNEIGKAKLVHLIKKAKDVETLNWLCRTPIATCIYQRAAAASCHPNPMITEIELQCPDIFKTEPLEIAKFLALEWMNHGQNMSNGHLSIMRQIWDNWRTKGHQIKELIEFLLSIEHDMFGTRSTLLGFLAYPLIYAAQNGEKDFAASVLPDGFLHQHHDEYHLNERLREALRKYYESRDSEFNDYILKVAWLGMDESSIRVNS